MILDTEYFKNEITKAFNDGMSLEDIAKQFTDTLNEVEKENAKQKAEDKEKQEFIDSVSDRFYDMYDPDDLTFDDIADFAGYVAIRENPDWDMTTINAFTGAFKDSFPWMVKFIKEDPISKMLNNLEEGLKKVKDNHKCTCNCDKTTSDEQAIKNFFNTLGL